MLSRREIIKSSPLLFAAASQPVFAGDSIPNGVVEANDRRVDALLRQQITDASSRFCGSYPDRYGLHEPHSAGGILETFSASYFHTQSNYHQSSQLLERMKLAAEFLIRVQTPDGNIDLLTTNFNSPPDTGFVVHNVATAAYLAKQHGQDELLGWIEPFLRNAGRGMAKGGVHTPNHRWVVSSALAQIHELFPDDSYLHRIDRWLAEGIDIDDEGQYNERSTTVYNAVSNRAFVVLAHKLKRPELLEPVRKNLDAMQYLLHPNGEVVTEISRRQDLNTRGTLSRYWFPLRYMAIHEGNSHYASMLIPHEPDRMRLSAMMEYPDLQNELPARLPLPDRFVRHYDGSGITRIRRGKTSATIVHRGSSRILSIHRGDAVINAVRFASAFFGKGQFVPERFENRDGVYSFRQEKRGPYYQPLDPPEHIGASRELLSEARQRRKQTEVCELTYEARIEEIDDGFSLHIRAQGTDNVPLAVEINLREGGKLEGCVPHAEYKDVFLLPSGDASYRLGGDTIAFGPGIAEHQYTQVRGALDKLSGPSVYLTSYTPFDRTLTFRWM